MIDENGDQVGVVSSREGVIAAQDRGLDLVEVAPNARPPVCRIMDYSRYKYEQEKKKKEAKKKQHVSQLKEIRFNPKIEEHDYQVKLNHIKKFLKAKDKVRVSLRFRGRENIHKELGEELLDRIARDTSAVGQMESKPKKMVRTIIMTLNPKSEENTKQ